MEIREILKHVDHTLLTQSATISQIKELLIDAVEYKTASACIPPRFVAEAKKFVGDKLAICTVIGFPNGYNTTATKVFETINAIENGADEIDMVINIGMVKEKDYNGVLEEIKSVKKATGNKILKVIIETCLLTQEEKIKMCQIVTESGANYIKTSTGFGGGGATREDISLFKENIGKNIKMKASGGIRSIIDAEDYLKLGCDRLGTSAIVKIVKEEKLI
ncbi:MAG: deoxyribose-phosphate aldolase [Clostridia bacterium]